MQLIPLVVVKILENRMKIKYLDRTWPKLYIKTVTKKASILQNILNPKKRTLKTSISLGKLHRNN